MVKSTRTELIRKFGTVDIKVFATYREVYQKLNIHENDAH